MALDSSLSLSLYLYNNVCVILIIVVKFAAADPAVTNVRNAPFAVS